MKRFLIIGSCLILAIGLTACGDKKGRLSDEVVSGSAVEPVTDDFDPSILPGEIKDVKAATEQLAEMFSVEDLSKITAEELPVEGKECYLYKVPFGSRVLKIPVYKTKDEEFCHYRIFVREEIDEIKEEIKNV